MAKLCFILVATVWHKPSKDKGHLRMLASVQRAALLRIISAFRTTATQTLEVECYVPPTHLRLKRRAHDVVARLCTLPQDHPLKRVVGRTKKRSNRKGTCARLPLVETMRSMNVEDLEALETIDPKPKAP